MGDKTAFVETVAATLPSDLGGDIMTIAEQFRQEGMELGLQRGMQQTQLLMAKRLLQEGYNVAFISKITGLSASDVQTVANGEETVDV